MSPSKLFVEILFALVGMGYFFSGKRRGAYIMLACGVGLGVFPYFVDRLWVILLVGGVLTVVPFVIRD